jgi:hypothetical protein
MNTEKIRLPETPEIIEVYLSPTKTPVAYKNRVEELIEECGMTREEAEREAFNTSIPLELVYEKNCGLFAVDSQATDCSTVWSPYSQKELVYELD